MHAIVMQEFGSSAVLRPDQFPDPPARPGWVTVALRASALNWHDVLVRQGRYGSPLPHIIGADGAGVRTDTGEEVVVLPSLNWGARDDAPGRGWEILGDHTLGTYAELVSVPADCLAAKPAGLSWAEAAALPLVGVTTYRALFTRGRLRSGESMLVIGAGGGIATMAVALAVAAGASITVTSSSPDTIDRAVDAGACGGVLHNEAGWPERAREMSPHKAGFDLVLDPVGRWSESVRTLRPGGRLVVLGANAAETAPMDIRSFYFGQFDLLGTTMGSSRDFAGLLKMIDQHAVRAPVIDHEFPLDRAAEAHEYLERGRTFGKCVLKHD
ncbi:MULTISPECIES: quinone oxidoreductase family protein [Mycobacterium]|uniref:Zinc-type alcohol dehydrogenase-like protein YogA n=1 Tax=Mycobacterium kiyosense TaxID=2871094 RepID=A0AA37UXY6_9MYCO|nr:MULTISPECIES: zinc-binding dehydrogenase [Mycobacterium]GLB82921.1 putative zinc-type alcohol dehydrogenase-like protein YogA [Mycobacterium kiyosense]GLB96211.1 putative zinc-type alcohol dehydrogenase-like protein YogA [Mycobacterium kiyosense]GLD40559.1 putative zinc-type alcohol dehydrogenase-like protein YogA [Mycobacterium kiyosense]